MLKRQVKAEKQYVLSVDGHVCEYVYVRISAHVRVYVVF